MANQDHLDQLSQGVEIWNQWRQKYPDIKPDLSGAFLRYRIFSGANFSDTNLNGADLFDTIFRDANLSGADLRKTNFCKTSFRRAILTGADLRDADLSDTDLRDVDFSGANLSGASLSWAIFEGANWSGVNLSGAVLDGTNWSGVNLSGAILDEANLRFASSNGAIFDDSPVTTDPLVEESREDEVFACGDISLFEECSDDDDDDISLSDVQSSLPPPDNVIDGDMDSVEYLLESPLFSPEDVTDGDIVLEELLDDLVEAFRLMDVHRRGDVGTISEEPLILEDNFSELIGASDKNFCYVHTEMDEQVIVNRVTTVEVIVSQEQLDKATSAASQSGVAKIDSNKRLIVQIISKINFTAVDADRVEIDPPKLGQPHILYFDLRATHLGEGEVWVVLRQSQVSLLTLVLRPTIVANRAVRQSMMNPLVGASAPTSQQNISQRLESSGSVVDLPKPSEPLHQLRIIERRNGTQITYLYELNSPRLGVLSLHESKPIESDRNSYVENLYKEIESRWVSTQGDVEDFAAELRAFGGQLFDQLFPEPLQKQLWEHREEIDNIMVISTEPLIPWELVHLKPPGQNRLPKETWFLGQMGLVRWLHDVGFPPEETSIIPGSNVHYVIPNYPDNRYRLPQAEQESQFLEQHFGATAIPAQPTSVRLLLEQGDFDLLHFAGHGLADQENIANAKLMLEGRVEKNNYVPTYFSATTVEQYCDCHERDRNDRPMIVLNACQIGREGYQLTGVGGFAQAFLRGGVGVFVGTLWSVGDRSARIFTETLYSSLINGMSLSEATVAARHQARQTGSATWLAYIVYGHPHFKLRIVNN